MKDQPQKIEPVKSIADILIRRMVQDFVKEQEAKLSQEMKKAS